MRGRTRAARGATTLIVATLLTIAGSLSLAPGIAPAAATQASAITESLPLATDTSPAAAAAPAAATQASAIAGSLSLATDASPAATTQASTIATIAPALSPDRLGAEGALLLTIHYGGGEAGIPAPVRRSVLRFPVGLGVEIPHLRSCPIARLRARGPSACPAQSLLGHGHALAEAQAGSQIISESIELSLFVGPFHNLQPTFEILGQGYTPFDERVVLTGTVLPDSPPYGEDLVLTVPPIPTLPLEPEASIVSMSLTVGTSKARRPLVANTVIVPPNCPAGGFPFAAEFTYADGSTGSALASVPCPR